MPNREVKSYHSYTPSINPAVLTADANGAGVDLQDCDAATVIFDVGESGDTLSGSVYAELEVQESDDNSTFTAVADADLTSAVTGATNTGTAALIDAAAEDDVVVAVGYTGAKRYIRAVVNLTGTHTNGIPVGAIVQKSLLERGPAS